MTFVPTFITNPSELSMSKPTPEPLRGNAAYTARLAEIAKRNDAARKRGAELRAVAEDHAAARRRAADRHERENLPVQPVL